MTMIAKNETALNRSMYLTDFIRRMTEFLFSRYNMANILSQANITPSLTGYTVQNIFDSVKRVLNATPTVECDVDKSKQRLISEIRICFNKSLELIDCTKTDGLSDDSPITNCALNKPIMYLDKVPPEPTTTANPGNIEVYLDSYYEDIPEDTAMVNFYKLIKFLMWFTF